MSSENKIITGLGIVFILGMIFMSITIGDPQKPDVEPIGNNRFVRVEDVKDLYYDQNTGVVYYITQDHSVGGYSYSYMTPYYAENGYPYTHEDFLAQNSPYNVRFVQIEGQINLFYDNNTGIVYYQHHESSVGGYSYSYMTAYMAENGLPYRYENEKLVMIEK